jgi:hypothetical protein
VKNLVEAVIPLEGSGDGLDCKALVYFGKNSVARQSSPEDRAQSQQYLEKAGQRKKLFYHDLMWNIHDQGCHLAELSLAERTSSAQTQQQMATLYARFGWTPAEVRELLEKPTNIISVVKKGNQIVSAVLGEVTSIMIGDQKLTMAEITEAATLAEFQGRGLYTGAAAQLIKLLSEQNVNLAFGECNGNAPGVLNAAQSLWRTFTTKVAEDRYLGIKGYLPQHVPIAGAPRSTPYNDLYPSFITRRDMHRFTRS